MSSTQKATDSQWESYRDIITNLYVAGPLADVMSIMEQTYGFTQSKGQYMTRFKKWGLKKNVTEEDWKEIDSRIQKRKLNGKDSMVEVGGKRYCNKRIRKELSRHVPLTLGQANASAVDHDLPSYVQISTPSPLPSILDDTFDMQRITSMRIISTYNVPCLNFQDFVQAWISTSTEPRPRNDIYWTSLQSATSSMSLGTVDSVFPSMTPAAWSPEAFNSITQTVGALPMDIIDSNSARSSHHPGSQDITIDDIPFQILPDFTVMDPWKLSRLDNSDKGVSRICTTTSEMLAHVRPSLTQEFEDHLVTASDFGTGITKIGQLYMFFSLIAHLASNNMLESSRMTVIWDWVLKTNYRSSLIKLIELKSPSTEAFSTILLDAAICNNDVDMVNILIRNGVNVNTKSSQCDRRNPLVEAISRASVPLVKLLLQAKADPNQELMNNFTETLTYPLLAAVYESNEEIVKLLLEAGATLPNECDGSCSSLLLIEAIRHCNFTSSGNETLPDFSLISRLLDEGAHINCFIDPSLCSSICSDHTLPLHAAISRGKIELVNLLIQSGANVQGPFLNAAGPELLDHISFLQNRAHYGSETYFLSPVQHAARKGRIDIIARLLQDGADINASIFNYLGTHLQSLKEWEAFEWVDNPKDSMDRSILTGTVQEAVKSEDITMVEYVLTQGANVNERGDYGFGDTALQIAAMCGNVEIAKLLIRWNADINAPASRERSGRTALQAACEIHDIAMTEVLLANGADVNAPPGSIGGVTSLQAAAGNGYESLTLSLTRASANVNAAPSPKSGKTALQHGNRMRIVAMLLLAGADVDAPPAKVGGTTALRAALKIGDYFFAASMIRSGARILASLSHESAMESLLSCELVEAARKYKDECKLSEKFVVEPVTISHSRSILELLIEKGADVNELFISGYTPLSKAAELGLQFFEILVEAGANITVCSRTSRSMMELAIQNCNYHIVQYLINKKIKVDEGALHAAILLEKPGLVRDLLQVARYSGTGTEWKSYPLLPIATTKSIHMVKLLLSYGVDVDARTIYGGTALIRAVQRQDADIVKVLIEAGADVNRKTPAEYHTAIQYAALRGNLDIVKLLLNAGAEVNAAPNAKGMTALQAAAQCDNLTLVELLLKAGADVNAAPSSDRGVTALQAAAIKGSLRISEILLQHGADPNAPAAEMEGRTALEGASEHGRLSTVQLLLNVDHEPSTLSERCKKAARFARDEGHLLVEQLLQKYF